jgi:adenine C2-methylase RlmN of 23S rRNA A2503 and tRNA A37
MRSPLTRPRPRLASHSMLELRGSVERVLAARKARGAFHSIMVEYVLLRGVNDSLEQARELAAFLLPLHDVTRDDAKPYRKRTGLLVNIIPFNEGADAGDAGGLNGFKRPSHEIVQSFQVSASSCVSVRECRAVWRVVLPSL